MAAVLGDTNSVLKDLTLIVEQSVRETRPTLYPLIATVKPEDGAYTKIAIATNAPFPKKFEGERSVQGKDVPVVITYNQDTYELTMDFDADLLLNAKAYDFSDMVEEAAMSAKLYPDYQASQMVIAGATSSSYESGKYFYASNHLYAGAAGNTINNTVAATGTTIPALFTDLNTAISQLRGFKDNAGRLLNPINLGANDLIIHCPVAMEQNFRAVLNSGTMPVPLRNVAATENVAGTSLESGNWLKGAAQLYVDGYLPGSTVWYLHYVGRAQKPFAFMENYGMKVNVLGYGSEFQINTNKVRIATQHRFVMGNYRFDRSLKVA